jgi:hypothetical protein
VFATLIGIILIWKGPASDSAVQLQLSPDAENDGSVTTKQTVAPTTPTTPPPPSTSVQPAQLTITVANGSGKAGVAGDLSDKLKNGGYPMVSPTNTTGGQVPSTTIYFDAGYEADARAVAAVAGLSPAAVTARPNTALPLDATAQAARVLIILGTDFTPGATQATSGPSG